jgi:phage terminase small subunit
MKGGHNRTTDSEKRSNGTFRPDRARPEPKYTRARPKMPANLPPEARKKWRAIVPLMERAGVLSPVHADVLEAYCRLWARYQAAPDTFTAALYGQLRLLFVELGVSPKSRSHVRPLEEDDRGAERPRGSNVTALDEVRAQLRREMSKGSA